MGLPVGWLEVEDRPFDRFVFVEHNDVVCLLNC